jgi:hypothetical protein
MFLISLELSFLLDTFISLSAYMVKMELWFYGMEDGENQVPIECIVRGMPGCSHLSLCICDVNSTYNLNTHCYAITTKTENSE